MANSGARLDRLLKWSLAYSGGANSSFDLSEKDRKWFFEAMQAQTIDVVKRMREITRVMRTPENVLAAQGVTPANIEDLLKELGEHVESIDMANDLHSIGGLVPLIGYLKNPNAGIRAQAAEVVTTIVQNNPKGQQLVMEVNGFEPLLSNFTSDSDIVVRIKALGAISSLIHHNDPGIAAFRLANGYAALRDALGYGDIRLQRKALSIILFLLQENSADCSVVTELGLPRLMLHLASSDSMSVREAALEGLLELVRDGTSGNNSALAKEDKLRQVLESRIEVISSMAPDELAMIKEERELVDSLWSACYNEPSPLRQKGLLVLPGEDEPQLPPDVAGKLLGSPLRGWSVKHGEESSNPDNEQKKATPLLLGAPAPQEVTQNVREDISS